MPSAWKVRGKALSGSGPTWDAMSTDDTDDYDALTGHKWEWTSTWTIFAKSTSDTGVLWGAVPNTWATYSFVLNTSPWSVFTNTRIQSDTEWDINAFTQVKAATET